MPKNEETRKLEDYSLFDDIENDELRIRNQSVIMRNIAVSGRSDTNQGKIKASAASLMMQYFSLVPDKDKGAVMKGFVDHCKLDGFTPTVGG